MRPLFDGPFGEKGGVIVEHTFFARPAKLISVLMHHGIARMPPSVQKGEKEATNTVAVTDHFFVSYKTRLSKYLLHTLLLVQGLWQR